MATNTMDAIKKKMQAMKCEKDNALEKADQLEQRVAEQKAINEKVGADFYCNVSVRECKITSAPFSDKFFPLRPSETAWTNPQSNFNLELI